MSDFLMYSLAYLYFGVIVSWGCLAGVLPELYKDKTDRLFKYQMVLMWPLVIVVGIVVGIAYLTKNLRKWFVQVDDSLQRCLSKSS